MNTNFRYWQTRSLCPTGAQECSHGWSAAEPVERIPKMTFTPQG
jgi:hypothetical protein